MSSDTIDWYLESIGRVPLLTADQEITLGRQVQEWMALKEYLKNKDKILYMNKKLSWEII